MGDLAIVNDQAWGLHKAIRKKNQTTWAAEVIQSQEMKSKSVLIWCW